MFTRLKFARTVWILAGQLGFKHVHVLREILFTNRIIVMQGAKHACCSPSPKESMFFECCQQSICDGEGRARGSDTENHVLVTADHMGRAGGRSHKNLIMKQGLTADHNTSGQGAGTKMPHVAKERPALFTQVSRCKWRLSPKHSACVTMDSIIREKWRCDFRCCSGRKLVMRVLRKKKSVTVPSAARTCDVLELILCSLPRCSESFVLKGMSLRALCYGSLNASCWVLLRYRTLVG